MRRRTTHTPSKRTRRKRDEEQPMFSKKSFFPRAGDGIFQGVTNATAFAKGKSQSKAKTIRLEGRTDANYSSDFNTKNVTMAQTTGCKGCPKNRCVQLSGEIVSVFKANPTVNLPKVSDFKGLTKCQKKRVQDAITGILEPHEQLHVKRFKTYDGKVVTPFSFRMCHSQKTFDQKIKQMHDAIDGPRQKAATDYSKKLDPFHFDVDLNCED